MSQHRTPNLQRFIGTPRRLFILTILQARSPPPPPAPATRSATPDTSRAAPSAIPPFCVCNIMIHDALWRVGELPAFTGGDFSGSWCSPAGQVASTEAPREPELLHRGGAALSRIDTLCAQLTADPRARCKPPQLLSSMVRLPLALLMGLALIGAAPGARGQLGLMRSGGSVPAAPRLLGGGWAGRESSRPCRRPIEHHLDRLEPPNSLPRRRSHFAAALPPASCPLCSRLRRGAVLPRGRRC